MLKITNVHISSINCLGHQKIPNMLSWCQENNPLNICKMAREFLVLSTVGLIKVRSCLLWNQLSLNTSEVCEGELLPNMIFWYLYSSMMRNACIADHSWLMRMNLEFNKLFFKIQFSSWMIFSLKFLWNKCCASFTLEAVNG